MNKIVITGASGFLGRRCVERFRLAGWRVCGIVRRPPPETPLENVEFHTADLQNPEAWRPVLADAQVLLHTAITAERKHDERIAVELYRAAREQGVGRFLHCSSIVVYGHPADGFIDEETPLLPPPGPYASTKQAIEAALRHEADAALSPELTLLRLGCIYGRDGWWTDGMLHAMRRGRILEIDGGQGAANLIHVEDVAQAIYLAAQGRSGIYNVCGEEGLRWRDYFAEFEKVLGRPVTLAVTQAEARARKAQWAGSGILDRVMRKLLGTNFVHGMDAEGVASFASRAVYSPAKTMREWGFRPERRFGETMRDLRGA